MQQVTILGWLDKSCRRRYNYKLHWDHKAKIDIFDDDISTVIAVNSLFRKSFTKYCIRKGIKFIHITTDCIFRERRNYSELRTHAPGFMECQNHWEPATATVIRASIIGEETNTNYSLLS